MDEHRYTLLCDFYELTMCNGYFKTGLAKTITYFDVFYRKVPDGGGFAIAAGLDQVIDYIENLRFTAEDIEFFAEQRSVYPGISGLFGGFLSSPGTSMRYRKERPFSPMNRS